MDCRTDIGLRLIFVAYTTVLLRNLDLGNWTNFVSFSLGFVSQATKHQSVQPILFYSFPIMFTLLLSAKQHQIILPISLLNFLIRSETKLVDLDLWMSILLDVGNGLEFTIQQSLILYCWVIKCWVKQGVTLRYPSTVFESFQVSS